MKNSRSEKFACFLIYFLQAGQNRNQIEWSFYEMNYEESKFPRQGEQHFLSVQDDVVTLSHVSSFLQQDVLLGVVGVSSFPDHTVVDEALRIRRRHGCSLLGIGLVSGGLGGGSAA